MDQEYHVEIVPFKHRDGKGKAIKKIFSASTIYEASRELNEFIDQFQTNKQFLNPKYSGPSLVCRHPVLGHDVMTEPFVHLKKYHRHIDGVVYLTYREFEPSYGEFPKPPGLVSTASLLRI